MVVTIVDRGSGIDTAAGATQPDPSASLAERMAEAGGGCAIETGPGLGTRVELRWPA